MEPFLRLKHNYSWSIVSFSAAWLLGLWLGHLSLAVGLAVVIMSCLLVALAWRSRLLFMAALIAGLVSGSFYAYQSQARYQAINKLIGQKATLSGSISDDPATDSKGTTTFSLDSLQIQNRSVPGAITVKTYSNKYQRGYKVQVTGKLYSVLGSKQAGLYGSVVTLSRSQTPLEHLRQRFIASINSTLPDPVNGFALGLLMGARSLIPKNLQDQLAIVGLSHLVAVSGYNLTIIVQLVRRLLKRTSRYVSLATTLWLIGGFVIVAGTSASIVRAAVVSIASLLAYYYGRQIKPWVLIAVPAVLTTLWRPEYLWSDVGWQLSFLAFIGILVMAPAVEARLKRPNGVKKLIIEAFCAQLLTFPIILAVFHQFSIVGVVANALVLPIVPVAMLTSFIAGAIGVIMPPLGLASLPSYIILKLMLSIIAQLAHLTWASISLQVSTATIVLFYGSLTLVILAFGHRSRLISGSDDTIERETINH